MLNACTIIARNYLPFGRVLAESFFAHHPDASFTILVVDDEQRELGGDRRIAWKRLGDLGLDDGEIRRLAAIYDVTELATAVKPLLLRCLLDEAPARRCISIPTSASTTRSTIWQRWSSGTASC